MELPVSALLRPLVAEYRAVCGELQRRKLLPPFAQIRAADAGRELRPKGERIPVALGEAVHLLGDDIGGLADGAGEHFGRFEHRRFDALKGVQPAHAFECVNHRVETVGALAPDILGASDPLRALAHRFAALAFLARLGSGGALRRAAIMNIDLIPVGDDPPNCVNAIIEVPVGGEPVKYEFDKKSGAIWVDRILHTPMRYPANDGFIPHTLSEDGDPLDVMVVARSPFIPGCVVRVRPIAVLLLEDEAGGDEKILAVPHDSTFPYYEKVEEAEDLPQIVKQQIEHFFTHYKDLEPEKWVRVGHWLGKDEACRIIRESIDRARGAKAA